MAAINRLNIRHTQNVSILESVTESLELSGETIEYTLEYGEGTHTISLYDFNVAKWEVIGTEYPEQFQGTWAKYCLPDCRRIDQSGWVTENGYEIRSTETSLVTGQATNVSKAYDRSLIYFDNIQGQLTQPAGGTQLPLSLDEQVIAHQADRYYPAGKAYTDCGVEVTVADWVYKNEQQDYPTRHYVGDGLPVPFHSTGLAGNNLSKVPNTWGWLSASYTCPWGTYSFTLDLGETLPTTSYLGVVNVTEVIYESLRVPTGNHTLIQSYLGYFLQSASGKMYGVNMSAYGRRYTNDPGEIKRAEPITPLNIYPERQTEPYTNTVTVRLPKELEPDFSSGLIITEQVDSSEGVYLPERITL